MALRFRLFYRGQLPSGAGRTKTEFKHYLRGQLHPQVRAVWEGERVFRDHEVVAEGSADEYPKLPILRTVAGRSFIPLASMRLSCLVEIDCLLLAAEPHGAIVSGAGDIDNRIKTLIDALRMPTPDEMARAAPPDGLPEPCYCLMDDDKIVRHLSVTADRLLDPERETDAVVIAEVSIRSTNRAMGNPYSYV
jgi:hypothetical protein